MDNPSYLNRGWILAALMLTMSLAAMDATIVSTAIPQIVADLGGFQYFTWVFSIYMLAQTITIPIYGKLSDLFGRKRILLIGIVLFLFGSAACALSWDIFSLIVFRGLQGLGAGSIMATVNTIAGDIYTVKERAKIQGFLSSIWGISAILGPALGGTIVEYAHWSWIFFINIPFGVLSIIFLIVFFKEKISIKKHKIDYVGATLISLCLGLLLLLLMEGGQSFPWFSAIGIGMMTSVIGLGFVIYHVEKKASEPILPFWLWKNKTIFYTNMAMIGMGMVMIGPEVFLPTYTQAALGVGSIASGLILGSMSVGWPTASALSGRLYLKIGFRATSLIGTTLIILACIGFLIIPYPQAIHWLVLDQIILGAGFGLLSTPSLVGIQSLVKWEQRGVVTSTNLFTRNLGQSVGAALYGAIFNHALMSQLKNTNIQTQGSNSNIIETINNDQITPSLKEMLRQAVHLSMTHVYWGLLLFALFIFLCIYRIPYRDPKDLSVIEIKRDE